MFWLVIGCKQRKTWTIWIWMKNKMKFFSEGFCKNKFFLAKMQKGAVPTLRMLCLSLLTILISFYDPQTILYCSCDDEWKWTLFLVEHPLDHEDWTAVFLKNSCVDFLKWVGIKKFPSLIEKISSRNMKSALWLGWKTLHGLNKPLVGLVKEPNRLEKPLYT